MESGKAPKFGGAGGLRPPAPPNFGIPALVMMINIRDLTTYTEFQQVQKLHQTIWGLPEGAGLYPPMLNTAAHNGGTVLGAFDGEQMVAFLFGFLGRHEDGTFKLCSQTMGVLPSHRGKGIGAALKWAQRQRMLSLGIPLITWTYDPLEAPNAYLNLHKLGCVASTYKVNLYGENFTALGEGLPSDRLIVEWWIESERVICRAKGEKPPSWEVENLPLVNPTQGEGLDREVTGLVLGLDSPQVLLAIPKNIQALKKVSPTLALDWRLKTRQAFLHYFDRGYQAVDLIRKEGRPYYALQKKSG